MSEIKKYKQLPIPPDSVFGRKTYNPYTLLNRWIYNKFKYTWFHAKWDKFIDDPITNIKYGIKNLWKWFPTIWKQRDWDQFYIYEILKKKLEFQQKHIISANRYEGIESTNRYFTLCLNLIERCQEDYYSMEYMDYKDSKFEFTPTDETKQYFILDQTIISENLDDYLKKYPNSVKQVMKKTPMINEKDHLALYVGHHNQEKCKKLLFKILNEKIETFWD